MVVSFLLYTIGIKIWNYFTTIHYSQSNISRLSKNYERFDYNYNQSNISLHHPIELF